LKNNKLIQALSLFTKSDWIDFRKFVLLKTREDSEHFYLFKLIQSNKTNLPNKEELVVLRKKYFERKSDKVFSNMLSQLYQWCEDWMIINQLYKDKYLPDLILLKALNRRGLFNLADQKAKNLEKKILTSEALDLDKSSALAELYHQQFYSDNPIKYKSGTELLVNLQANYLKKIKEEILLYTCEFSNWGQMKNISFESIKKSFSSIIVVCSNSKESDLLEELLGLIEKPQFGKLENLKHKLFNSFINPSSDLHVIVYMYLLMGSIKLLNQGKLEDRQVIFDLFSYGFESGVLLNSGKIPEVRFNNMVNILANMKSEKETEQMIEKWYTLVNAKNPEAIRLLAIAQNKVYHKSYNEIIPLLRNFDFELGGKLRALGMMSIAYYEEAVFDTLYNHLENFERTLHRSKSKVTKTSFLSYKNFILFIKLLLKRKADINIADYKYLIFRPWVVEKLNTQ